MGTAVALIGIGCIIAAIVGGGIKVVNIEFGAVHSLWRQFALFAFGAVLTMVGLSGGSSEPVDDLETELTDAASTASDAATAGTPADSQGAEPLAMPATAQIATAESAAPEARDLFLRNSCAKPIVVWIVHKGPGGWTDNGKSWWEFGAGEGDYLGYKDRRLKLVSGEVYFHAMSRDNAVMWEGTYEFETWGKLQKLDMSPDSEGDYTIELTCN